MLVTARTEDIEVDNIVCVSDIKKGLGPIMGMYTGLSNISNERVVVNPVDTPNVTEKLLLYMVEISNGYDIVMPRRGNNLEPLISVYSKNVIPIIERTLNDGLKPAPHLLVKDGNGLKVRILEDSELKNFGNPEILFQNINAPEDLKKQK